MYVLVVEDELRLARVVRQVLKEEGHTVDLASDGREVSLWRCRSCWRASASLMRNDGRVLTRSQILDHVWGYDFAPDSNIVEVYITYLRRKVDQSKESKLIRTVRGAGYVMKA